MIALFFDTETTGVKSYKDPDFIPRLVQLGAILQDLDNGRVLAEVNLITNLPQGASIPAGAVAVHGITDLMCAQYGVDPKLIDITFGKLAKMADVLVAHNTPYDLDIIKDNMPLTQSVVAAGKETFDTMLSNLYIVKAPFTDKQKKYFAMKGYPDDAPYKIPNLMETYTHYFGVPFEGAHDAMADIRACRDIFVEMKALGYLEITDKGIFAAGGTIEQSDKGDK